MVFWWRRCRQGKWRPKRTIVLPVQKLGVTFMWLFHIMHDIFCGAWLMQTFLRNVHHVRHVRKNVSRKQRSVPDTEHGTRTQEDCSEGTRVACLIYSALRSAVLADRDRVPFRDVFLCLWERANMDEMWRCCWFVFDVFCTPGAERIFYNFRTNEYHINFIF